MSRRIKVFRWRRTHVFVTFYRRSWRPRRWAGGQATPGPWVTYYLPLIGEMKISWDRTLFGWDDEVNR